jgi:hypothetical protein
MDGRNFDGRARVIATRTGTRRAIARHLGCGALAGLLRVVGLEGVLADCKEVKHKCDHTADCCGDLLCRRLPTVIRDCRRGRRCCKALGEPCDGICECCGDGGSCWYTSRDTRRRCCLINGERCTHTQECCGSDDLIVCENGRCTEP